MKTIVVLLAQHCYAHTALCPTDDNVERTSGPQGAKTGSHSSTGVESHD